MKKRSALIFGLLAVVLAFSMVLAGCDDPNKESGSTPPPGGGITIASFEGEWENSFNHSTLTVTKVAGENKFTLVYSNNNNSSTYTYTLSYTGSIEDFSSNGGQFNFKGVPFTGVGKRTSGSGTLESNNDLGGLFERTHPIAATTPSDTATPAGYLGIDTNGYLSVFYVYSSGASTIDGEDDNYGGTSFERPE